MALLLFLINIFFLTWCDICQKLYINNIIEFASYRLTRDYMCSFLGYLFYFLLLSNFSWVTVFGLDLYWSIHKLIRRDPNGKQNYGLSVQLPAIPPIFLLALFASRVALSDDFLVVHHIALASLVACIFGLLILSIDLLRNCQDEDRGPLANVNLIVGLGLPLLLTAGLATLHLLLPRESLLNPQVAA